MRWSSCTATCESTGAPRSCRRHSSSSSHRSRCPRCTHSLPSPSRRSWRSCTGICGWIGERRSCRSPRLRVDLQRRLLQPRAPTALQLQAPLQAQLFPRTAPLMQPKRPGASPVMVAVILPLQRCLHCLRPRLARTLQLVRAPRQQSHLLQPGIQRWQHLQLPLALPLHWQKRSRTQVRGARTSSTWTSEVTSRPHVIRWKIRFAWHD